MQESTITSHTPSGPLPDLERAAHRAERWFGEPFLHPGEDADVALAPGTARRLALDDAIEEIDAGNRTPSSGWKVRYGLMLGLERVLAARDPGHRRRAPRLRRHQIDALAGMLTELIAATQRSAEENGNGSANGSVAELVEEASSRTRRTSSSSSSEELEEAGVLRRGSGRVPPLPLPPPDRVREDHRSGGVRRGGPPSRDPDPHPSPPSHRPVPPRSDDRGLRRAPHGRDRARQGASPGRPDHDPDIRLVRPARRRALAQRVPARDLRRGAHRARREDLDRDPALLASRSTSA